LANRIGCRADLTDFINRHPEKLGTFSLAALGVAFSGIKTRLKSFPKTLALPFRDAKKHVRGGFATMLFKGYFNIAAMTECEPCNESEEASYFAFG
jgi:hypothetical protein